MPPPSSDSYTVRIVTLYSLFTCIYTSLFMFILFYYKNMYNIGKRTCMPLIAGVVLAECFKLTLSCVIPENTNTNKTNKTKKYNLKSVFKSILITLTMIITYYIIAVLFGAPFVSEHEETLMFSLLLTALTVVPPCLNLGADVTVSVLTGLTTFQGDLVTETIKHSICFTLFGAWLGAIVIPLDWDRPWQVWPIPCSLGAFIGYTCSHIVVLMKLMPKFTRLFVKKTGKYGL